VVFISTLKGKRHSGRTKVKTRRLGRVGSNENDEFNLYNFLAGFLKPTNLLEVFHLHLALSSLWRWCECPYLIL